MRVRSVEASLSPSKPCLTRCHGRQSASRDFYDPARSLFTKVAEDEHQVTRSRYRERMPGALPARASFDMKCSRKERESRTDADAQRSAFVNPCL